MSRRKESIFCPRCGSQVTTEIVDGWTHCQACGQEICVGLEPELRTVCEFRQVAASFCGLQYWPGRRVPLELWTLRESVVPLYSFCCGFALGSTLSDQTLRENGYVPVPVLC
jgi:hypothetical protein